MEIVLLYRAIHYRFCLIGLKVVVIYLYVTQSKPCKWLYAVKSLIQACFKSGLCFKVVVLTYKELQYVVDFDECISLYRNA